jgi:CBS domain-containing protein
MKAKDVMVSPVVTISEEASLEEAARRMLENRVGSLLVVDQEGRLVGIVTETDFLKERGIPFSTFRAPLLLGRFLDGDGLERVFQEARSTRVSEIMTRPVHRVQPEAPLREVLDLMLTYDINHVPVVDEEGRPVGIISRFDLLRPLLEKLA